MASSLGGPKLLNGKIVIQAYMLDNSYKTVLIEPHSTVQDVCRSMAEMVGMGDPEDDSLCFSLNECLDGAVIGRALPADKEVMSIMEGWTGKPEAKFVFQCKLYTDSMIKSTDPKIVHLLFIQGVYNVISGTYPTTAQEAVQFAAWQFQAKFGAHNAASHRPGFLTRSIQEYIPSTHYQPPKTAEQWEEEIFRKHAFSTTLVPREAYLSALAQRDYYGAALFVVKQTYTRVHPRKLLLGISRRGILLLRTPKSPTDGVMETLAKYPLADIYRWAYKPGVNFYFEIKAEDSPDEHPIHTFETIEGKHMSDMLTDYAMALLREMGLNADGTKRVRARDRVAASVAAASAAPPGPAPGLASSPDSYKAVAGDVGSLATAAVRSGEYSAPGSGAPPPPPSFAPPPPPPEPAPAAGGEALPPNWIKVLDESSNDYYYFNSVTGDSVWDREEIPAA